MRRYTAQEMRELAGQIEYDRSVDYYPTVVKLAAMLRQAADMMERERKYEYATRYFRRGKCVGKSACHYATLEEAKRNNTFCTSGETMKFVRREVGDWEEV